MTPTSIRQTILETTPFTGLIREKFPDSPAGPSAFEYAVEGQLRGVPGLSAVDGFQYFRVVEETHTTMRIVAIAHVLPSGAVPLEAAFWLSNGGISYWALLGSDDAAWKGTTKSKRWNAVCLYATEGYNPTWNWTKPLEGVLVQ